jgi:hypothetical protein
LTTKGSSTFVTPSGHRLYSLGYRGMLLAYFFSVQGMTRSLEMSL